MQFFHLSHKSYLFKLIFNIFTILFILAQDNSIKIDICIISPNPIMWYQSSTPSNELLLCQWKLSLLCSLWTTVAHLWAKPSWGTCREALWGTPHRCGLVIPATLYDHLGGWVPGGNASAPCSGMHPGTPRRPTRGRLTIHVGPTRLPMTSQAHTSSARATIWAQCLGRKSSPSFYLQGPDYT